MVSKAEFVGNRHGPDESVLTVANVETCTKVIDSRGTSTDLRPRFQQEGIDPGPGEIRTTDEAVVPPTNDDYLCICHFLTLGQS